MPGGRALEEPSEQPPCNRGEDARRSQTSAFELMLPTVSRPTRTGNAARSRVVESEATVTRVA